jgi:hypothetical protein
MDNFASNNYGNSNCCSDKEEKYLKKKVLVVVLALLFSSTARLQRVKADFQTEYPLASGLGITSPSNRTYISNLLTLNVTITAIVASNIRISMTYSLDGMINKTIPLITHSRENSFQATITGSVILPSLSYGSHNVTVFAEHTINNELVHLDKNTVYFTRSDMIPPDELIPPIISNISLENKTYTTAEVLLSFNIDKTVSWIAYCIDNQKNITLVGLYNPNVWVGQFNETIKGLAEGSHSLVVYANNTAGISGASERVQFTVRTNSDHEIPEFHSWIMLSQFLIVTLILTIYTKRMNKLTIKF